MVISSGEKNWSTLPGKEMSIQDIESRQFIKT